MKVVGIKQLKARLSEYVRLAKAGEPALVTELRGVCWPAGPNEPKTARPIDDLE